METKDLNSIGLAYLEMVEKKNIEAKKNHANALHKNQKALDVHSDEDEDHNDDPTDGDGDIDAADLKKLRKDADKDDKKFDKKKKSSKKDDDQDKFKAYSGDDTDGQQGAAIGEDAKYPHMMYDPKTGKEFKAETPADHEKYAKMGYTHDKPEEIDEASTDLQEGAARQAAFAKGLMDYCKEIGKDHMDHKDFMDHAKHVKAGNWDEARKHADNQDTEVREKIHTLAIDHLGQGAASELYGGDRVSLSKKEGDGKLHASYNESVNVDIDHMGGPDANAEKHNITIKKNKGTDNSHDASGNKKDLQKYLAKHYDSVEDAKELHPEVYESVNVDDVLALIDQGYTLDQAEAMVAEACGGGGGGGGNMGAGLQQSRKYPDDKKLLKASRKQSKAGDNDRNMANDQRSIPAKGADTAPVRPGTKQQQRDFDKAARMAKSKDKVSVAKAPWESVEVDEGYGSMVSPEDRARIKARVDANMDKLSAGQKKIAKQTPPRHKITGDDFKHLRKHGHGNSPQKESVMDRVSNMVEGIRAKNEISELHKKTLGSYAKKAMDDVDTQSRFATEYEKRGMAAKNPGVMDKNFKKANRADDKLRNRKAGIKTAIDKMTKEGTDKINELDKKTLGSYIKKATDDVEYRAFALGAQEPTELGSVRKGRNRIKGIARAADSLAKEGAGDINNPMRGTTSRFQGSEQPEPMRVKTMSKKREKELRDAGKLSNSANNASHYAGESVQEASKPTGIHHPIDPTPGKEVNSKDAAGRAADIRASRNPLSMTEKEFVEMHQVPTTVDPAFDGNVAAKQTAENAKKAPIKQAKTPNIPTSKGDQKIMPDPTPYGGPAVKTESYMDKYAKYIRGENNVCKRR